jgi:nucleoside-diphosphate-sugar epimerase
MGSRREFVMRQRVFLAGASGAIGRRLIPLLRDGGDRVTGMTRSPASSTSRSRMRT